MKSKSILNQTIVALILGPALISIIVITYYSKELYSSLVEKEITGLHSETKSIEQRLHFIHEELKNDTFFLSETPPINGIIRSLKNNGIDPLDGSTIDLWKKRLGKIFVAFLDTKPMYDEVRYLGLAKGGKEIVRVDRYKGVKVIKEVDLQSKEHRPYFFNGVKSPKGVIFFSDITLRVDQGKIVVPNEWQIRSVLPVYDGDTLFGMIVINLNAEEMVKSIQKSLNSETDWKIFKEDGHIIYNVNRNIASGRAKFDSSKINHLNTLETNHPVVTTQDTESEVESFKWFLIKNYDSIKKIGIIVSKNKDLLTARADRVRKDLYIIFFFFLLITVIMVIVLLKKLLSPANEILGSLQEYPERWIPLKKSMKAKNELGYIASSVTRMVKKIEEQKKKIIEEQGKAAQNAKLATLGELAAGVAHEINNPMAIIQANASILSKKYKGEEKLEKIAESTTKSVSRVSKIVMGLKKFSRSADTVEKKPCLLEIIVSEALKMLEFKLNKEQVKFEIDIPSEIKVFGNEVELEQVFVNLIQNSADAVSELETKWIRITSQVVGSNIVVEYRDSGSGLPLEIRDKIFNPFFTTKEVGKGTGLGLSISKGILEEHGGGIEYLADDPHTCFQITLPIYNKEE